MWHEEPLAPDFRASDNRSVLDVAKAVAENRSVISVPDFATEAEVALLTGEAARAEEAKLENPLTSSRQRLRFVIQGRTLTIGSVVPALAPSVQLLAEVLVQRAIAFVQTKLPALATFFGLVGCDARTPLDYSEGEPAINIYYGPGGDFQPHQDMRALTLLVSLSTSELDYEGGGTSFFAADAQLGSVRRGRCAPAAILRPLPGTALLWGGTQLHAGAEVTSGRRVVFVASFTPVPRPDCQSRSEPSAPERPA